MFHKIAQFFKLISLFILVLQGQFLQKITFKRLGYDGKKTYKGCSIELTEEDTCNQKQLDDEVRLILKQCKNNPNEIIKFFEEHNTKVYQIKDVKKRLQVIHERKGLITERTGLNALYLNYLTKQPLNTKTSTMVLLEDGEPDVYFLMHSLHKWCAIKNGFPGLDEKSQRLLMKMDGKNKKFINSLSLSDITTVRAAIARDVQSIDFVLDYAKEHAGAKQALEKLKQEGGASI